MTYSGESSTIAWEECISWYCWIKCSEHLLGLVGLQYCSSPPFPYWSCLVLSIIDSGILNYYWSTVYFSFQFCRLLLHILIFWGSVVRCVNIHNCYIFLIYFPINLTQHHSWFCLMLLIWKMYFVLYFKRIVIVSALEPFIG